MELRERISGELLPFVKSPGQYIGGEVNQLVKPGDWQAANVKVAMAFPDSYTIGMSHLGCQILYWLCNHTPGVVAERVFCPWVDAEKVMRSKRIPLFTWDSRQPVVSADILAISLQYEMGYTNILTMLDLAGIPLHSASRDDSHPLVIGGGPQADAPEPMAPFLDLIVLGDGEASMSAILAAYQELKAGGMRRRDMILEMARRFEWIYAPNLYDFTYKPDGTIAAIEPMDAGLPRHVVRCQTRNLDETPFPTKPIVPFVKAVHERISIEIMRGCPQRCRFCHAGYTKRPISRRTVDEILDIAEEAYWATGFEEIGLLSLSTADYPYLPELARRIEQRFTERKVSISVPSMRVDRALQDIPWMVNAVRKGGLTLAVEAARDDMRDAIKKHVTDGRLLDSVVQAYKAGWKSLKLYFMAGFPGERPEDIDGIYELGCEVSAAAKPIVGMPAAINASVGWLVPKPHTPMQWCGQKTADYFHETRLRFKALMREKRSAVRVKTHNVERSVLEGVFSLGDRRLAPVIERAWRDGARFDGWDELFDYHLWDRAFEAEGIDPAFYAHRDKPQDEILPWSHLAGGGGAYLERHYQDMITTLGTPDGNVASVA